MHKDVCKFQWVNCTQGILDVDETHRYLCSSASRCQNVDINSIALTFKDRNDIKNVSASGSELTYRCRTVCTVVIDDAHNFGFLSGAFFDLFFFSLASLKNSGALLIVSRAAMPIASASISDSKYSLSSPIDSV